jgi:hypothetical protein
MRLMWCHLLATTVLVGVAPATAAGCGSASSKEAPSSPGADSDSGTGGGGAMDGPPLADAGTDSASTPDRAVPETGSVDDSGSGTDASLGGGLDAGPDARLDSGPDARPDSAPDGHDAGAIGVPPGCTLPSPVSFKNDVQPFLASSCGNTGGTSGCHVLDATSTVAQGGYDHAYDWITGTAHASSCPETPTPFRFQVVMAVLSENDPSVCSKCPEMPPTTGTDPRTPLTACQAATLQSWLDEPLVTQTHRNDGISPTTPYPMPPFN